MAGLVVLATRGRGLRSGTEENNAKRQWNRRAKKSFQSFHRPLLISAQVIELKKRNMFADGGRLCCDLLRAIDTDMTLARDAIAEARFNKRFWFCVRSTRPKKEDRVAIRCERRCRRTFAASKWSGPASSPASRRPDQGQPLALKDLIGRHFRSHRVAKPQIIVAVALCRMCRGQVEPFI